MPPDGAQATPLNSAEQAGRGYALCPDRRHVTGQHQRPGSPGRRRGVEKNSPQAIGRSRGGRTTKIHLVAATARQAVIFCLSAGNEGDALRGRELLMRMGRIPEPCHLLMDHVYEGDETHELAQALGFIPVVPPSPNRKNPWDYDTIIYKRRNEVERLIRRVKSCRRVFTRYDKLDIMFLGFIVFAFIVEFLRLC